MTIRITQYKWAGRLWPFEIKTKCKDCDLTEAALKNMLKDEFKGKDVVFEVKPWLDNFLYCLFRFAWHAPIIMVDGKKFHQFSEKEPLFDRKKLQEIVLNKIK